MNNSPVLVVLAGAAPAALVWDKAAICRAEECGLFQSKGTALSKGAKYLWAMLPDSHRAQFPNHYAVANAMPPLEEVDRLIVEAIKAAGEGMSAKNVYGSMSGLLPPSSLASPQAKPTGN